jgi:hypothetical protein
MPSSFPSFPSSIASSLLDLSVFGQLTWSGHQAETTFQLDVQTQKAPEEFWFGIVALDESDPAFVAGFAIRIDLARGEVWDGLNGGGLLGTLDLPSFTVPEPEDDETLPLSLKIEKLGPNLLPSLHIAGRPFLCPALPASAFRDQPMIAVAGASQPGRDAEPFCLYPAFWLSQPLQSLDSKV